MANGVRGDDAVERGNQLDGARHRGDVGTLGFAAAGVVAILAGVLTGAGLLLAPQDIENGSVLAIGSASADGQAGSGERAYRAPPAARALPPSPIAELSIPAIDLESSAFVDLRSTPAGTMEVPGEAGTVGWFAHGATPGERGAAVLAGHATFGYERGVFHDVHELAPQDTIIAHRTDGTEAIFTVYRVEPAKDGAAAIELATEPTAHPDLRIITSAGMAGEPFPSDGAPTVVFARMTGTAR